jgi:putative phage-type endonuclease
MALTEKQLSMRKVGGSDVATILGLNPFKTALELYYEKKGIIDPPDLSDNDHVEAGNVLEDGIAALAERRISRRDGRTVKLRRSNLTLSHPKYDWLTIHIDRDVVGEERGVELKNVGWRAASKWGPEETEEIPAYYKPQVHTYLLVKDYPVWTVAAYLGGGEMRLYDIARNKEWDQLIIEATHDFWYENVGKGIPPAFDPNLDRAVQAMKRIYPGTDGTTIEAPAGLAAWRDVRAEAKQIIAMNEKVVDGCDARILREMGSAALLNFDDGSQFTRRLVKRKAYTVEAAEYMDLRFRKAKEE